MTASDDIKGVSLDGLKTMIGASAQTLATFQLALGTIVPELLRRLELPLTMKRVIDWVDDSAELDGDAATLDELRELRLIVEAAIAAEEAGLEPVDPGVPEVPVDPSVPSTEPKPFEEAADHYDADKFATHRAVSVTGDMDEAKVAYFITDTLDKADGAPVRVYCFGELPRITLGGKTKHAITRTNGEPIGDIEFRGTGDEEGAPAYIYGLKFDGGASGIDGEVRLSGDLVICPTRNGDGTGMGDKAPIATLVEMPNLMLVILYGVTCQVSRDWGEYNGMGCKWMVFLSGCTLIVEADPNMAFCDPAREHSFYIKNMRFVFVQNAYNASRLITDAAGDVRLLGNGRTFEQHSNRIKDVYPKGGAPSAGRVVFKDCVAYRCGWEGMLATDDYEYEEVPVLDAQGKQVIFESSVGPIPQTTMLETWVGVNPGGKASGGSDYTNHGNTGDAWELIDCRSVDGYCGSVASWNEVSKKKKAPHNPEGVRCWMIDNDGGIFDPTIPFYTNGGTWGTRRVLIDGFRVEGDRAQNQRTPFLLSGMAELVLIDAMVEGEFVEMASPHLKLNHQAGQTPIDAIAVTTETL